MRVLVGSGGDLQGVDLADTHFVHQMEALASEAAERQLDGRAVRARSMCGYPATAEGQTVIKFRYLLRKGVDTQLSGDKVQREASVDDAVKLYDLDRALRQSMRIVLDEAIVNAQRAVKQGRPPRDVVKGSLRELHRC